MRVHVWAENRSQPEEASAMRKTYPLGIEVDIAVNLQRNEDTIVTASNRNDPMQGFDRRILDRTDVLVYWSKNDGEDIDDANVDYLQKRVLDGMGMIVLHSAHSSKIFQRLMGTRTNSLRWRNAGEWQRYWIVNPAHPVAEGLEGEYFEIPADETYGEYFEIPQPHEQVFITQSQGGDVFRSGNCWMRGLGRIFYFEPGHETYPVYRQREVMIVLSNAVRWACRKHYPERFPDSKRESNIPIIK